MAVFSFTQNWWWFLIIFVLILGVWRVYLLRNRQALLLDKSKKLLKNFRAKRNSIKAVLASVAFIFMGLALLHPQWGRVTDRIEQQGRDLIIALDISRSMLAQDVAPDRLSCAKTAIAHIMEALESDRVALMVFSEKARMYCPLTKDQELVKIFLEQIDYTILSAGTTCLDQPIYAAIQQCKRYPQRKRNVLLLVTDGEDFSGALAGVKDQALACGLTILVIGVGTSQGAPIPVYGEQRQRLGYLKDAQDHVVISHLNKMALQSLTKNTGGLALFIEQSLIEQASINQSPIGVHEIVDRIKQFEKERQELATITSFKEQYPWFLLVSFSCLLFEWLL